MTNYLPASSSTPTIYQTYEPNQVAPQALLGPWGTIYFTTLGLIKDYQLQMATDGFRAQLSQTATDDALGYIGQTRNIESSITETSGTYRTRLQDGWGPVTLITSGSTINTSSVNPVPFNIYSGGLWSSLGTNGGLLAQLASWGITTGSIVPWKSIHPHVPTLVSGGYSDYTNWWSAFWIVCPSTQSLFTIDCRRYNDGSRYTTTGSGTDFTTVYGFRFSHLDPSISGSFSEFDFANSLRAMVAKWSNLSEVCAGIVFVTGSVANAIASGSDASGAVWGGQRVFSIGMRIANQRTL